MNDAARGAVPYVVFAVKLAFTGSIPLNAVIKSVFVIVLLLSGPVTVRLTVYLPSSVYT